MEDLFHAYWWLLFPLCFFIFGAFDRYLNYRRYRDNIELLKSYAAQGREPPPELLKAASEPPPRSEWSDDGAARPGNGLRSPYKEWRNVVMFAVLAGAFFVASFVVYDGRLNEPFVLVAVIMAAIAVASAVSAVFASLWKDR